LCPLSQYDIYLGLPLQEFGTVSLHLLAPYLAPLVCEAQSILKEVQKEEGVTLAKMEIIEELMYIHEWLAKEVRTRALARP
jgi:hypothetical protein